MYGIIFILVIVNFFATLGWMSLLTKIFNYKYNFENHFVWLTIIISFAFVIVPAFFPKIILQWILGAILYLIIGFIIIVNEGNEMKKKDNII